MTYNCDACGSLDNPLVENSYAETGLYMCDDCYDAMLDADAGFRAGSEGSPVLDTLPDSTGYSAQGGLV